MKRRQVADRRQASRRGQRRPEDIRARIMAAAGRTLELWLITMVSPNPNPTRPRIPARRRRPGCDRARGPGRCRVRRAGRRRRRPACRRDLPVDVGGPAMTLDLDADDRVPGGQGRDQPRKVRSIVIIPPCSSTSGDPRPCISWYMCSPLTSAYPLVRDVLSSSLTVSSAVPQPALPPVSHPGYERPPIDAARRPGASGQSTSRRIECPIQARDQPIAQPAADECVTGCVVRAGGPLQRPGLGCKGPGFS
jgi:hypothetical protein